MRKLMLAVLAGSTVALSACSGGADTAPEATATEAASDPAADAAMVETGVLDANTATEEQLAAANGVSPELAAAIVAGQPYASVTDLHSMLTETLSDEEAATVLTGVFVPVNLNSGTEEELRLIPGMTDKMEHEFLEYRPYDDMTVFDREMGKYVDEAEVARFRNYVTL
ncbi:helix-hairpin-helix domain-containing protein [Croceicoccus naphthovorans]|uniref:Uncharacterized protein n=1 Tax=Croceicoccus naphthovorans TaxID=1348774 RepID=A0A0G3XGQ8_9SPHN|nr:helix-hairpin-helix domain-containing protein [Croceicoccus naphthovorans]AKM10715.1 hypothetical protein AB433_13265 [Croceicoccus naphthovorans]MBB3991824.1 DNA uptake protein ComE-like DNA-binding protein [Croceicoccus naphthovorans]